MNGIQFGNYFSAMLIPWTVQASVVACKITAFNTIQWRIQKGKNVKKGRRFRKNCAQRPHRPTFENFLTFATIRSDLFVNVVLFINLKTLFLLSCYCCCCSFIITCELTIISHVYIFVKTICSTSLTHKNLLTNFVYFCIYLW